MHGLIVRSPWVEQILQGRKTWEIRGINTKIRGRIALIKSGSGTIVGTCDLVDVRGPLTLQQMCSTSIKHLTPAQELRSEGLPYKNTYAWVLANPHPLEIPIPYNHPSGAIVWVTLPDALLSETLLPDIVLPDSLVPTAYRSPGDNLRRCFLESLARDLSWIGHKTSYEPIEGVGAALQFEKAIIDPETWHEIYKRIRARSLREDETESAFIRRQEQAGILDLFLDGKELEVDAIDPELVIVGKGSKHQSNRDAYRYCRHLQSVPTSRGVGRKVTALLYDRGQKRRVLMGALSLSSSGYSQGLRDGYLGWDKVDSKAEAKRVREFGLKRMMQLSVCLAVQPYSQLHVMKLMALLSISDPICEAFHHSGRPGENRAKQPLLAVVTTSAFGLHAAGFNRIQLSKIIVNGGNLIGRNELFKRIDRDDLAVEAQGAATGSGITKNIPPVSTMICSDRTVKAAREIASFVLAKESSPEDPMRNDHSKDRVLFRALSICGIPRQVLAVNEKGVYFSALNEDHVEALRTGQDVERPSYLLPFESAVDYWRRHVLPKAQKKADLAEKLCYWTSDQLRLSRILDGETLDDKTYE